MKILTESGLVNGVRDGAWMRYTLRSETTEEAINFINDITNDKDDCICKQSSCKVCTEEK